MTQNLFSLSFVFLSKSSHNLSNLGCPEVELWPGGLLPYSLGKGCAAGFAKVLPIYTRVDFANFVTLYQSTFSIFCYYHFCPLSDPVKQDPILDQFSMITRPYPRVNGLKTIPFPAAHTRIANIWEYPPGFMVALELIYFKACFLFASIVSYTS